MESKKEKPEIGSEALETDRRRFLRKSLGAAPVVLTLGNKHGWGGKSVHGTLWSSGGTRWNRGGRGWRDRGWDKPPRFGRHGEPPKGGQEAEPPRGSDSEWKSSRISWRKWRPDEDETRNSESRSPQWEWRKWRPGDETQESDWRWGQDASQAPVTRDVPVSPIDETIRPKD
jgi:hypothetical protein